MSRFATLLVAAAALLLCPSPARADEELSERSHLRKLVKSVDAKRMKRHLFHLASDAMEGRESGSAGGHAAALFVEEFYARCNMEPAGTAGFFQPWGGGTAASARDTNWLRLPRSKRKVDTYALGEDFRTAACSAFGLAEGKLVFAGYGISAPDLGYDDYDGLKVRGKIVLVLDHEPQELDPESKFAGTDLTPHADLAQKAKLAQERGAIALIVARDTLAHPGEPGFPEGDALGAPAGVGLPVIYASSKLATALAGRKDLAELQEAIDAKLKPASCTLKTAQPVTLRVSKPAPGAGAKNIIALKRGVDPKLKDEFIVISAHYDHVGRGSRQNSKGGIGQIHNGADDNASGTCALMELAFALESLHLKRSVLLMSFDAEEKGLLGSKHYVSAPTVDLGKIVTILNVDMISRNAPAEIYVGGLGRNGTLDGVVQRISKRHKLFLNPEGMDKYIKRSDQWPFMERGVPGLFFYGGSHNDYHTAGDDPEKSNLKKMKLFTQVVLVVLWELANADDSPR